MSYELRNALVAFASAVRSGTETDAAVDAIVDAIGAIALAPKQANRSTYMLKAEDRERILGLVRLTNEHRVREKLGVGRSTLARAIAGLPVRRGSLLMLEDGLRNTDTEWAARVREG